MGTKEHVKIADNVEEVSAIECQGCLVCVNISEDPRRSDCYLKLSYYIDLLNNAIKRGDKTVLNKDGIPLSNFFVVEINSFMKLMDLNQILFYQKMM